MINKYKEWVETRFACVQGRVMTTLRNREELFGAPQNNVDMNWRLSYYWNRTALTCREQQASAESDCCQDSGSWVIT